MKKPITIVAILLAGFGSLLAQMPVPQVYSFSIVNFNEVEGP